MWFCILITCHACQHLLGYQAFLCVGACSHGGPRTRCCGAGQDGAPPRPRGSEAWALAVVWPRPAGGPAQSSHRPRSQLPQRPRHSRKSGLQGQTCWVSVHTGEHGGSGEGPPQDLLFFSCKDAPCPAANLGGGGEWPGLGLAGSRELFHTGDRGPVSQPTD